MDPNRRDALHASTCPAPDVEPGRKQRPILLGIDQVGERVSLSKPSIYKLIKENKFPKQIRLCANKVAWVESEIDAWLDERLAARGE